MPKNNESSLEEPFPSYTPEELLEIISEHTQAYNQEDDTLPVKFTDETSCITPDGEVRINPIHSWKYSKKLGLSENDALRVLLDTLSHEVEHYNESDLSSKKEFAERFSKAPRIAGGVVNIVEDCYIDHNRLKRFEGLRKPFNAVTKATADRFEDIDETDTVKACMEILTRTFRTGSPPDGLETDFMKEFSKLAHKKYTEARRADKQEERLDIAATLTATILDNVEKPEDEMPRELQELLKELMRELQEEMDGIEADYEWMTEEQKEEMDEEIEEEAVNGMPTPDNPDDSEDDLEDDSEDDREDSEDDSDGSGTDSSSDGTDSSDPDGSDGSNDDDNHDDSEPEDSENDSETPTKENKDNTEDDNEDSENQESETREFSSDKFRETSLGEGGIVEGAVTRETISEAGMKKSKSGAKELSGEVKETLEKLEENNKTRKVNSNKGSELDIKRSIRYMSGDKTSRDIYRKDREIEPDNRAIGITIDASGSMRGKEMENALQAAGAIGKAADILDDDFTVNTHWSDSESGKTDSQITGVEWLTRLNEDFSMDDLDDVETRIREPIALGIRETRKELQKTNKKGSRVLFVIHDGNPTITAEGKPYAEEGICYEAVDNIAEEVQKSRELGYTVIGIAVGKAPKEDVLNDMFTESGWFRFQADDLADKLLTIYRNQ